MCYEDAYYYEGHGQPEAQNYRQNQFLKQRIGVCVCV